MPIAAAGSPDRTNRVGRSAVARGLLSSARWVSSGLGNLEVGAVALPITVSFTLGRPLAPRAVSPWLVPTAMLKPAVPDLRSIGPLFEFLEILGVGLSTHCEIKIRDVKMKSGEGIPAVGLTS